LDYNYICFPANQKLDNENAERTNLIANENAERTNLIAIKLSLNKRVILPVIL